MSTPRTAEARELSDRTGAPGESWASHVSRTTLEWVHGHQDSFRLPDDVLAPHTSVNRTLKPLGELAQLTFSIRERSSPGSQRHRRASALLDFAWEQTGQGRLFLELLRGEPFTTYPLEIYAPFAAADLRHAGFEELAATVCGTHGWARLEQEPNRRLGVLNSERRVGFPRSASRRRRSRAPGWGVCRSRGRSSGRRGTGSRTSSSISPTGATPHIGCPPNWTPIWRPGCPLGWTPVWRRSSGT